jgi:hypothetical protein
MNVGREHVPESINVGSGEHIIASPVSNWCEPLQLGPVVIWLMLIGQHLIYRSSELPPNPISAEPRRCRTYHSRVSPASHVQGAASAVILGLLLPMTIQLIQHGEPLVPARLPRGVNVLHRHHLGIGVVGGWQSLTGRSRLVLERLPRPPYVQLTQP